MIPGAGRIALVGDSVFDNAAYTRGEPDVTSHLSSLLPAGWRATLMAVDGATTTGIRPQMRRLPRDITHIVLSVGGNDALQNSDLLQRHVASAADVLALFAERVVAFEVAYRAAVDEVRTAGLPTTVCTIYNGNLPPAEARIARVALMMFNDAILRVGIEYGLSVIDLRAVCSQPEDYANAIEPSGTGGRKIAHAIMRAVGLIEDPRVARVFS